LRSIFLLTGNFHRKVSKPPEGGAVIVAALAIILAGFSALSQNSPPPPRIASGEIIGFLTKTIDWYHQTAAEQQIANEPADVTFVDEDQRVAPQVVQQAFDFARQQAQSANKEPKSTQTAAPANAPSQYQSLAQAAGQADQQVQQAQNNLDELKAKLETSMGRRRSDLESQIAAAQSDLGLLQARRDTLNSMLDFINGASAGGLGATGLRAQIEELARSVPAALNESGSKNASGQPAAAETAKAQAAAQKPEPGGLWGLGEDLFSLSRKKHTLQQEIAATSALQQSSAKLRAPMVAALKSLIQAGNNLTNQSKNGDPKALAQQKQQLDALTAEFKQLSAALLPLGKQNVLLDLYKRNLANWEDAVKSEFSTELRALLTRAGGLAILILIVIGLGELWRKAIYKYVQDGRRRYQFLLLRSIALWIAIAIVVALTFATQLSSVVTFAGLLTAGIAVALQNVIVSIVGYFFLIGKFGIRVGDRVQISGVNGEVVDVGLVRMHLMELSSDGIDVQPTGRVVAFSNAIVFQPTAGLFKQIPGTSFLWHEITLTFSLDTDYHKLKQEVLEAVERALAEYREGIERQRRQLEMSLSSVSAAELKPRVRLHFTASGIEVLVRFPVVLQKAGEITDAVMKELLATVEHDPKLKLVGTDVPKVPVGT